MTWVRLDDKFHRNEKMRSLSDTAHRVYVRALSYCADCPEPTGFLTAGEVSALAVGHAGVRIASELVLANAWEVVNGGYLIHDYDKYLDKGSRDRTRAWRDKKRAEPVTSPTRHRDVSRARRVPVPVPEPVPVTVLKEPSVGSLQQNGLTIASRGYRGGEESIGGILGRSVPPPHKEAM